MGKNIFLCVDIVSSLEIVLINYSFGLMEILHELMNEPLLEAPLSQSHSGCFMHS